MALWVGPALLVVAAVLPAALLAGSLPKFEVPPYQYHPMDPTQGAWLAGPSLVAAWAALVIVYLSLRGAGRSREQLWRLGVPLLYFGAGLAIAWANTFIAINIDRPYTEPPDSAGAAGLLIDYVAGLLVAAAGVLLGRRAADSDRVPRPRPINRALWIREVRSRVVRMRTAVVFPAPLGPRTPRTVPSSASRSSPSSAQVWPYDLRRPSARMGGSP